MSEAKPFLCKIGAHSWFTDSSLIRYAYRCNRCGVAKDAKQAAELDAERQRIMALPGSPSRGEMLIAAAGFSATEDSAH